MRALILAAGFGTRLMPLTEDTPKALVSVNNRPMLDYTLDLFEHYNFKEVRINGHYKGSRIESYVQEENKKRSNMELSFQDEREKILGSGGAVAKARSWLYEKDSSALIWNADSLLVPNLSQLLACHEEATKKAALLTMILVPYPKEDSRYMSLGVEGEKVLGFYPYGDKEAGDYHFVGGYILHKDGVKLIPDPKEESSILETVWKPLAKKGNLFFWRYTGPYADLGYVEALRKAEERIRNGEFSLA